MRLAVALVVAAGPAFGGVSLGSCVVEQNELFGPQATCEATNTGSVAVAHFEYAYTAKQDGRTVPWDQRGGNGIGSLFAAVAGGIEPGETVAVSMMVNQPPAQVDPSVLRYEFNVIQAYDVDSQPIP